MAENGGMIHDRETTRMKKIIPVFIALGLILVILLGVFGFQVLKKYIPSNDPSDLNAYYGVSGDEPYATLTLLKEQKRCIGSKTLSFKNNPFAKIHSKRLLIGCNSSQKSSVIS